MWYEAAVRGGRERAFSGCERSASRQCRGQKAEETATGMRIGSSRHLKNWKPTPVSDFARHPYMLMNLGQRDEPQNARRSRRQQRNGSVAIVPLKALRRVGK